MPDQILLDVYGDESVGVDVVTYGLLVVPVENAQAAEGALADIKQKFRGTAQDRLHCRSIFHKDARAKSPWRHLSPKEVVALYGDLMQSLKEVGLRSIVAVAKKNLFPSGIPAVDVFPRMLFGDKQIAAMCGNAAMIPLTKNPGLDRLRLWADPDRTPIEWLGRTTQATNAINFFVDNGAGKEPPRIKVTPIQGPKPVLLEVADFIAYASQREASWKTTQLTDDFKKLLGILRPGYIRFGMHPDGKGLGINVPNDL